MKTLYLECNMGAAGDMLMAALYELLTPAQQQQFLKDMNALGLAGVALTPQAACACGIAGTHMQVTVHGREETPGAVPCGQEPPHCHDGGHAHSQEHGHSHDHAHEHDHGPEHEHGHDHPHDHGPHHHHATPAHIADVIDSLPLPAAVREKARAVYDAIAQAEAHAHGCPVGEVHYHEVGALDAVADVTGVCYALSLLAPGRIVASPVHVGSGTVRCAHGVMPVPAPATAQLLAGVPIYGGAVMGELCTPTGAALLKTFVSSYGPMPAMAVEKIGVGVGTKQFEQANCVRAFWGEGGDAPNGEISEIVCNLDDISPEALAYACTRLLDAGALDVYTTPGTMKKGRPGWVLTVLCQPERESALARAVLAETSTNGLRVRRCAKYFLQPTVREVQTPLGPARVKTAQGYGVTHQKPEFEDAAALAREAGLSYTDASRAVLDALE